MTHIAGPAGTLFIDEGGTGGVPVVFVHSFAGDTTHWTSMLEHLRKTRRAIALDLRGHGRSQPPDDGDYRLTGMADDVGAVVDALNLESFILVGHSVGGSVSALYTGRHPGRVAGLVLVDATADLSTMPDERKRKYVAIIESEAFETVLNEHMSRLLVNSSPKVREKILQGVRSLPKEASATIFKEQLFFDPTGALTRYPGPKYAVVTPLTDGPTALHRTLPGFTFTPIKHTSHWPHLDRPEEFNKLLDGFIQKVETTIPVG